MKNVRFCLGLGYGSAHGIVACRWQMPWQILGLDLRLCNSSDGHRITALHAQASALHVLLLPLFLCAPIRQHSLAQPCKLPPQLLKGLGPEPGASNSLHPPQLLAALQECAHALLACLAPGDAEVLQLGAA